MNRTKRNQTVIAAAIMLAAGNFPLHANAETTTASTATTPAAQTSTSAAAAVSSATATTTTTTTATTTTTTTTTTNPLAAYQYLAEGDGVTITAYRWCDEMTVSVPAEIDGLPVTKIGADVFKYCYADEVVLPETVTEIGENAFAGCRYLTKVVIPKNCKRIAGGAFKSCQRLETVEFPADAPEIEPHAFDDTTYISRISDEFVVIGDGMLYTYHGSNPSVQIPDTVKRIGANAFANHPELTEITIPASVERIYDGAFDGCTALSAISLNGTPQYLSRSAFTGTKWYSDSAEDSIILGNTLISCKGDSTEAEIPDGVLSIAEGAFANNPYITTVKLPASVQNIQDSAFENCSSLQVVTMEDSVENIGNRAFFGCSALQYLRLGHSLQTVGKEAFCGCSALTELYLPDTVADIGTKAIGWNLDAETGEYTKNDALTLYANAFNATEYAKTEGIRCAALPEAENTKPAPIAAIQKHKKSDTPIWSSQYRAGLIGSALALILVLGAILFRKRK